MLIHLCGWMLQICIVDCVPFITVNLLHGLVALSLYWSCICRICYHNYMVFTFDRNIIANVFLAEQYKDSIADIFYHVVSSCLPKLNVYAKQCAFSHLISGSPLFKHRLNAITTWIVNVIICPMWCANIEKCLISLVFNPTLRPRQNGCHFVDEKFKAISVYGSCILIAIPLKYCPKECK